MTARWPGFEPTWSVLLGVDPDEWPPPSSPVRVGRVRFAPKHELHVTVLGRALGTRLATAIARGELAERTLADAFAVQDWTFTRTHTLLHLAEYEQGRRVQTLIEPVVLPAMAAFHARVGELLRTPLPVPPPHVTLYVHATQDGIGVPDPAALRRLSLGRVDPRSLLRG